MIGFFFKLFLLFAANGAVLWAIDKYLLIDSFSITAHMHSYLYIGSLIGIMNLVLKPILYLITFPFRIFMLGASSILFNGLFLFFASQIITTFPETQTTVMVDGILTYLILGAILAFANAVFHAFGIE